MPPTKVFQEQLWDYYAKHGRNDLPWRQPEANGTHNPYKIMVSEIMLQQTQVGRIIPKYQEFVEAFPNLQALANASFANVLKLWNGLGYNRRSKFLLQAARKIQLEHSGHVPSVISQLVALPGVGPNTAAAIAVYAYNQPHVFVETNIRSVFIHHFFKDRDDVTDQEIMPLIEMTINKESPRIWYWALMDYGSYLKKTFTNPSRRSKHHTVQSRFEGSRRQLRAKVLRSLLGRSAPYVKLQAELHDGRLLSVLDELEKEGLVMHKNKRYRLYET